MTDTTNSRKQRRETRLDLLATEITPREGTLKNVTVEAETREEPQGSGEGRLWGRAMDQSLKREVNRSRQCRVRGAGSHSDCEKMVTMRTNRQGRWDTQVWCNQSSLRARTEFTAITENYDTIERRGYKKILSMTIYIKINHFMPMPRFFQVFFFLTDSICNKTGTLPHFLTSRSQVKTHDAFWTEHVKNVFRGLENL